MAQRPQTRGCRNGVERIRELHLGRLNSEIIALGPAHADAREIFFLDFRAPKTALRKLTRQTQNIRLSAIGDIIDMSGQGPNIPTISAPHKIRAWIIRRNLELEAY